MKFDCFDWGSGNKDKCRKHGVSIYEVESLFLKALSASPDLKHSKSEQRFRGAGTTSTGRHLFIIFTLRNKNDNLLIRPISARYMHKKEIKEYEKEIS